jgi:hypothetical protein
MTDETPGIEAWKEHTTAFDRVQSVAATLSEPRPASYIADEAHVAENTARAHLERLVTLNVLLNTEHEDGALYSPDPLHTRIQTLRDLLEEHDRDGLIRLKVELQSKLEDWEDDYSVASPEELRTRAAVTGNSHSIVSRSSKMRSKTTQRTPRTFGHRRRVGEWLVHTIRLKRLIEPFV